MFSGLIETISKIEDIKLNQNGAKISYLADFDDVKIGHSIALNGVCLTVVKISKNLIEVDVMNETLKTTNLQFLKKGDEINLERALLVTQRLHGHIVSGHVDCVSKLSSIKQDGFSKKLKFDCNSDLIVKKGSIAVNGTSLTVSEVFEDGFEVSLIPETISKTNLKNLEVGDIVNIEYDILAKYLQKFSQVEKKNSKITTDFLKENGFF